MTINKWGALASFLLTLSLIVAPLIYLTGNLRESFGSFSYSLADFLYGPVAAASLVTVFYVLRERIGEGAPRRMDLALIAAVLSAFGMTAVAFIRAYNRQYHILHPDLHLESSQTVLIVWGSGILGLTRTPDPSNSFSYFPSLAFASLKPPWTVLSFSGLVSIS